LKKKKNYLSVFFKLIYYVVYFVLKTVTVDLFYNLRYAIVFSFNPEEKDKIKRKMESEKMVEMIKDRLRVLERLVYAMNDDPDYLKSDKGKFDLKELKKSVK